MKRRQPTEAQKIAAAERRQRFRMLVKQVASMPEADRLALVADRLIPTCEGETLSPHNTLLVMHQCPTVSMVCGFRQWLKVGRHVRKDEHGYMIWVPRFPSKAAPDQTDDTADEIRFLMGTVFDVAQTDATESEVAA